MPGGSGGGSEGSERSARNEVKLEDVAEQLDATEGKLDDVMERSIQNEPPAAESRRGARNRRLVSLPKGSNGGTSGFVTPVREEHLSLPDIFKGP